MFGLENDSTRIPAGPASIHLAGDRTSLCEFGRDVGSVAYDEDANTYTIDPDGTGPAAPFTLDNPDFTIRSLRGTAVLRWEFRPGSTLYFVWTQLRSGYDPAGDWDFGGASSALLSDRATNVFQVKATYWLGR